MSDSLVYTTTALGTVVTLQIVGHGATRAARRVRSAAVTRAAQWFHEIGVTCTRFDPQSPLRRLTSEVGRAVVADTLLYVAVQFGLAVAEASEGAYDPTVGHYQEARGFNQNFQSGARVDSGLSSEHQVSYRDVLLDPVNQTVTVTRPLILDLGGLAKGLAIDLAARELSGYENVAIDAGGDILVRGHNLQDQPWSVGIQHPRDPAVILHTLELTEGAVCTSGDYARPGNTDAKAHHLFDPRRIETASSLISATVLAPSAMVADALATAAFVLGPTKGLAFLMAQGVEGLLVTPNIERYRTPGMSSE